MGTRHKMAMAIHRTRHVYSHFGILHRADSMMTVFVFSLFAQNTTLLFLHHLFRDDLINLVKMSVRPYVRPSICTYVHTSTIKLNAATNQIVVFVRVDEAFTTI